MWEEYDIVKLSSDDSDAELMIWERLEAVRCLWRLDGGRVGKVKGARFCCRLLERGARVGNQGRACMGCWLNVCAEFWWSGCMCLKEWKNDQWLLLQEWRVLESWNYALNSEILLWTVTWTYVYLKRDSWKRNCDGAMKRRGKKSERWVWIFPQWWVMLKCC